MHHPCVLLLLWDSEEWPTLVPQDLHLAAMGKSLDRRSCNRRRSNSSDMMKICSWRWLSLSFCFAFLQVLSTYSDLHFSSKCISLCCFHGCWADLASHHFPTLICSTSKYYSNFPGIFLYSKITKAKQNDGDETTQRKNNISCSKWSCQ